MSWLRNKNRQLLHPQRGNGGSAAVCSLRLMQLYTALGISHLSSRKDLKGSVACCIGCVLRALSPERPAAGVWQGAAGRLSSISL